MYFHFFFKLCPKDSKNVKKFSTNWVNWTMYNLGVFTIFWPKTCDLVSLIWKKLIWLLFSSLSAPYILSRMMKQVCQILKKIVLYKGTHLWGHNPSEQVLLNIQVHNYMLAPWIPHWLYSAIMNIKQITVRFMYWGKNKSNNIMYLFRHTYTKPVFVLKGFSWSMGGINITLQIF